MATAGGAVTDELRIRGIVDDIADVIRRKDVEAIMAHYVPDVLAFDAVSRLQFKGVDDYREHWKTCLDFCEGPTVFEVHELGVTVLGDLAFSHSLTRCSQ